MANRNLNEINFTFEGVAYKLRPTFAALCEVEDKANETIPVIISNLQSRKTLKAKQLCAILYGGILGGKPDFAMSFEDFCEHIVGDGLGEAMAQYQTVAVEFLAKCLVGRQEKKTDTPAMIPAPANE